MKASVCIKVVICFLLHEVSKSFAEWKTAGNSPSQYQYFSKPKTFHQAASWCAGLNSHLVFLETEQEADDVHSHVTGSSPYWIGLIRESSTNPTSRWLWSTSSGSAISGNPKTFDKFKSGESTKKDKDRAFVDQEYWITDIPAAEKGFICEKEAPAGIETTVTVETTPEAFVTSQYATSLQWSLPETTEHALGTDDATTKTDKEMTPSDSSTTKQQREEEASSSHADTTETTSTTPRIYETTSETEKTTDGANPEAVTQTSVSAKHETSDDDLQTSRWNQTVTPKGGIRGDKPVSFETLSMEMSHSTTEDPAFYAKPTTYKSTISYNPPFSLSTKNLTTVNDPFLEDIATGSTSTVVDNITGVLKTTLCKRTKQPRIQSEKRFNVNDMLNVSDVKKAHKMFTDSDGRASAIALGSVGIATIVSVIAFAVLLDLSTLRRHLALLRRNLNCDSSADSCACKATKKKSSFQTNISLTKFSNVESSV